MKLSGHHLIPTSVMILISSLSGLVEEWHQCLFMAPQLSRQDPHSTNRSFEMADA